jgi:hypothetical protein
MPFTVSHVAAVLPFRPWLRREGVLAAAVIGSMSPDFDLFLPYWLPRAATHGRLALLTFCLPMGLAAWTLFQLLIRPALVAVAPDRWWLCWRQRSGADLRSWRTWLLVAIAIVGGAITHLVWDGFTHEGARGVEMLPVLEAESIHVAGRSMHLYRVLQHTSSVVGLAIIAWWVWRWHRSLPHTDVLPPRPVRRGERYIWLAFLAAVPTAAAAAAALASLPELGHRLGPGDWVVFVVEVGMGIAGATLLVVSSLLRVRLAVGRARSRRG